MQVCNKIASWHAVRRFVNRIQYHLCGHAMYSEIKKLSIRNWIFSSSCLNLSRKRVIKMYKLWSVYNDSTESMLVSPY